MKQKSKRPNNFDICFSVIFSCYEKSYLGKGDQALGSVCNQLGDFRDISEFHKILGCSTFREATLIQSLLYKKSISALLVGNETYTKTSHCFIILFKRLYLRTY